MNSHNQRQLQRMLEMIGRYHAQDISLDGLANNMEGLVAALEIPTPQPWVSRLIELQVALVVTAEIYTFGDSSLTAEIRHEIEGILAEITAICGENLTVQGD